MTEIRMIAVDLDGTLLGADGRCGARNLAALKAAEDAGIYVAIATGRRHCYALHVLRELGLRDETFLVSSNGAVVRDFSSALIERTLMDISTAEWLCGHLDEFRNALVVTFDRVGPDGEDERGALVIEEFEDLQGSIAHWMRNNERYIALIRPIEDSLREDAPIQMMLCGTVERMRRAEAHMAAHPNVAGVGVIKAGVQITLNRTEYPARDLSIVDILPAGCSKGAALVRLAAVRGFGADRIMAIGDNWNDLSMLEVAGLPVLMGNAPADLNAIAAERGWLSTCANDADGVAEAIFAAIPELEEAALTLAGDAGSK
jgi:Cof subfamily protein (haloacid dehalogenase superfamily)